MGQSIEKLAKIGWVRIDNYRNPAKITLAKTGIKRTGIIKIDIENKQFICYNLETTHYYTKTEIRDLTLDELILIYKLQSEMKNENKNKPKTERRNQKT